MLNVTEGRNELAKYFKGRGAEIGVEQGAYSEVICKANPETTLYCVDAWRAYKGYRDHTRQSKLDGFYETTIARLKPYNATIIRKFSMDAVDDFPDQSLDFVYIDANHSYENVITDIYFWSAKVKKGGLIAGHDYIRRKGQDEFYGVVDAVNEYLKGYPSPLFIFRGDEVPSWLFINV